MNKVHVHFQIVQFAENSFSPGRYSNSFYGENAIFTKTMTVKSGSRFAFLIQINLV